MKNQAIVVLHVGTDSHPIRPEEVSSVTEAWREVDRIEVEVPRRNSFGAFDGGYPWLEAAAAQREAAGQLRDAMAAWPAAEVIYMGYVPVPLAIHFGSLLDQATPAVVFQHHHENHSWGWPSEVPTANLMAPTRTPAGDSASTAELLLRVSCSYRVLPAHTTSIAPGQLHEMDLAVRGPEPDVLRSAADLDVFAAAFRSTLDRAHRDFPRAPRLHLAAAVPVGAAFAMGLRLSSTIDRPIQTWKYLARREQRYVPALAIGEHEPRPNVLLLAASPVGEEATSAVTEIQDIDDRLTKFDVWIRRRSRPAATVDSLSRLLEQENPTVLHIAAHGSEALGGSVVLSTDRGWSCTVGREDFLRFVGRSPRLQCLVLATCDSANLARASCDEAGVPTALGWHGTIGDEPARALSLAFWDGLLVGRDVQAAFDDAVARLSVRGRVELFSRPDVEARTVVPFPELAGW